MDQSLVQVFFQELDEHLEPYLHERFKVISNLGRGSFGIVWKVQDRLTQKFYALKKVLDPHHDTNEMKLVYRELMILKNIHHPNIVNLIEVINSPSMKYAYLLFEYMNGTLHDLIYSKKNLNIMHKGFIIYELVKGLAYLHSANIIHRDIKPENTLLSQPLNVKICDFGLSRSIRRSEVVQKLTTCGTLIYQAP